MLVDDPATWTITDRMAKIKAGEAGWEEKLKNFDDLQEITFDKKIIKDKKEIEIFTFKGEDFKGY